MQWLLNRHCRLQMKSFLPAHGADNALVGERAFQVSSKPPRVGRTSGTELAAEFLSRR
jgi:hypothetical protein